MNTKSSFKKEIVHKWLSLALLSGFVYYWLFTLGTVFFFQSVRTAMPRQTLLYYSFFNQNWRLFSSTKTYSTQLDLVVRNIRDTAVTDTIRLVSYSMEERKKYAPFNNYQEAVHRLFIRNVIDIEGAAHKNIVRYKKEYPANDDFFYIRQASLKIESDSFFHQCFTNLRNYSKYVLDQKQISTSGKEFQLSIVHYYISPAKTPVAAAGNANNETVFISAFKPL